MTGRERLEDHARVLDELRATHAELARQAAEVAEFSADVHEQAAEVHARLAAPLLTPDQLRRHAERDRRFAEAERQQAVREQAARQGSAGG